MMLLVILSKSLFGVFMLRLLFQIGEQLYCLLVIEWDGTLSHGKAERPGYRAPWPVSMETTIPLIEDIAGVG